MEPERARELLAGERRRIERELAELRRDGALEGTARHEPGERDTEDLYEDEIDEGRRAELQSALAAVDRAEARLQAGTFGLSIESGTQIPDGRLELIPTAERTVEEEQRYRRA
jgi:DnaK suppressor protein